jgi:hypothetical protein
MFHHLYVIIQQQLSRPFPSFRQQALVGLLEQEGASYLIRAATPEVFRVYQDIYTTTFRR